MRQPRYLLTSSPERSLGRLFTEHSVGTTLVVSSSRPEVLAIAERLAAGISGRVIVHARASSIDDLDAIAALVRELARIRPDAVVSLGGGAVHDLMKTTMAAASTDGDVYAAASRFTPPSHWEFPRLTIRRPVFVTMPSTFSGSEANGNAGFRADGEKRIVSSDRLVPDAVVLDASMYRASPPRLLVESIFNALNHAIEAASSTRQGPLTPSAAVGGMMVFGEALRATPESWSDEQLVRLGATSVLVATGQSGASLGLAHAIPHVLGARYGVRHGLAHAIVAPHVARFNQSACADAHLALATAFAPPTEGRGITPLADLLADAVRLRLGSISLGQAGVTVDDVGPIAADVALEPGYHFNPRSIDDIASVRKLVEVML
ncbi:iron-containing alcohol dehydrogenase [Rhizomonospora bruguierae]|uniref:iron-containing alcohol dehydrogenase n=1 Tax=Rhizomonospora bruguierae TaxID=1581705 RepID=UPI001BCB7CC9|nr:iron-containing alcohol dehydrogenase [Micromonospora sp. NBRC 107566]